MTTKPLSAPFYLRSLNLYNKNMNLFRKYWPIFFLFLISVVLCIANYTPNTFLSGWDTLHPEFNFNLNFQRTFFGVFRTEQGLGAVAAHSHMADLPRIFLLYLEHFILPESLLRYSYIFLNLILGPIGMYLFLEKHLLKNKLAAFLGGLFYLLNYGTLQIFNVPFEMFTTLFATLPFIFLFATNFLDSENRTKNLLLFSIFTLFNSPSAYAATLWYVFFLCFIIYVLSRSLIHKKQFKSALVLIFITLLINSFWLVPNLYFILNHAKEVQNANINLLFSEQAFLKNKEFGNLSSVLLLKNFYFDWSIYKGGGQFIDLLSFYINYLKNLPILALGYVFGFVSIAGLIYFAKTKAKESFPLLILFVISLFFFVNANFPFTHLFNFLQNHLPFFKEALRFPQDKILNIHIFLVSIFFAFACKMIISKISKHSAYFFTFIVILILAVYNLPSFNGNLINKLVRINIPNEYFQLFNHLNTENPNLKVANLPISSPWGWVYYNWNDQPSFQGAGFLYFGIKQPLLDRDFDRWNPKNESYFREMSYAIYSKNSTLLQNTIKKYQIGFILLDRNVIDPEHKDSSLYFSESEELLKETGLIKAQQTFGKITLFTLKTNPELIRKIDTNLNINPEYSTTYIDSAYANFGDYIVALDNFDFHNISFPFRNILNNQSKANPQLISVSNEKITLTPQTKLAVGANNLVSKQDNLYANLIIEKKTDSLNIAFYPISPIFDDSSLTTPIRSSVETKELSSDLLLSVNENQVFELSNLPSETPVALDKISLKNSNNTISIFDKSGFIPLTNIQAQLNPFFSGCKDKSPLSAIFTSSQIKITAQEDICALIPYGFFPEETKDLNILTNFSFDTQTKSRINACLFSQETSKCIYYLNPNKNNNTYTFSIPLNAKNSNTRAIKIFFENENKPQNLTLQNFTASYSKSLGDINIPNNLINQEKINSELSFNNISIPLSNAINPGFDILGIDKLTNDCQGKDNIASKNLETINGVKQIKYDASLGIFCDHFSYPNLDHQSAYLLIIEAKNIDGLPLNICLTNYTTRRCDIYTSLTNSKEFTKNLFIIPATEKEGIGYDLNIEANGIKGTKSTNYLKSIEFVPIPYEMLNNLEEIKNTNVTNFNGDITNYTVLSPNMYLVNTNSKAFIINLNYVFEKGFKAYPINCSSQISCILKSFISPFTTRELEHVMVNNWSNGWVTQNNKQIVIIFLPQYLEIFGFGLLVFTLSFLSLKHIRKSK